VYFPSVYIFQYLTLRRGIILEKLLVTESIRKILAFKELEDSLQLSLILSQLNQVHILVR
jgi:hypothetical protein